MKKAFIVDFDGTMAKDDIGHMIIKKFAQSGWRKWEDLWIERRITTSMMAEAQWDLVTAAPEEILEFVSTINLNEGFKEFSEFIIKEGYRLVIVSDGFDFYINPFLKQKGFEDLEVSCSHLEYKDGWKFSFPNKNKSCVHCGNCKKTVVSKLKAEGYKVHYVGDGFSDRCSCIEADVVYATSHLARFCDDHKIPHIKFKNFRDILNSLEEVDG